MVTFEGDNTVMLIQSTRYIRKVYDRNLKGEVFTDSIFSYLNNFSTKLSNISPVQDVDDLETLLEAFEINASNEVAQTFKYMDAKMDKNNKKAKMH